MINPFEKEAARNKKEAEKWILISKVAGLVFIVVLYLLFSC
mgnify:FL=1